MFIQFMLLCYFPRSSSPFRSYARMNRLRDCCCSIAHKGTNTDITVTGCGTSRAPPHPILWGQHDEVMLNSRSGKPRRLSSVPPWWPSVWMKSRENRWSSFAISVVTRFCFQVIMLLGSRECVVWDTLNEWENKRIHHFGCKTDLERYF
jgi:hypothetical protein